MDDKKFLESCDLINKNLINQVMNRTYNSFGSNIFLEFGKQKEIVLPNGKKRLQNEWSIWLSWTSWSITHSNKFVTGSGESSEVNIQGHLEKLLGKKILSFQFISQFLDLQIDFEDGYQITTFFNYIEENQWIVFLSNNTEIIIDCSSQQAIKHLQTLSHQLEIKKKYSKFRFLFKNEIVKEVLFEKNELLKISCADDFSIHMGLSAWRLKKNGQYLIGRKDYYFEGLNDQKNKLLSELLNIIGKKVECISVDASGKDVNIEFEDEYILELYTHSSLEPWMLIYKETVILSATI